MGQTELNKLESRVFQIKNDREFEQLAIELFHFQYDSVPVYRNYCELLKIDPSKVQFLNQIPFLPISAFKHHNVLVDGQSSLLTFKSSGTTQKNVRSTHSISKPTLYKKSLISAFTSLVDSLNQNKLFSLLPGYEENKESSLIYMLNVLSEMSVDGKIHRFPNKTNELIQALKECNEKRLKHILFGVSFALIDLAETKNLSLPYTTIIETGGMKGNRKEITRSELHEILRSKLNPARIISEYGMTEMLSQAYAINSEWFECPPWLKILVRDVYDPLTVKSAGSGALNIVDLANVNSCSFIASDDLGIVRDDKTFKVLGRFDHSDVRGCNLLYTE